MAQRRPAPSSTTDSMKASRIDETSDDALFELLAPDGYYHYLGVPKPQSSSVYPFHAPSPTSDGHVPESEPLHSTVINADLVKRNYRKLSRKHHPDRPGGNVETFRILHRAHKVLLNEKLRQQYDILGIDLDDDEEDDDVEEDDNDDAAGSSSSDHNPGENDPKSGGKKSASSKPTSGKHDKSNTIVQEIASTVLAVIMQLIVRTVLMACVACLVVRFRIIFYPALLFMLYIVFKSFSSLSSGHSTLAEVVSPAVIALGLALMRYGYGSESTWAVWFWFGEAAVLGGFAFNSLSSQLPRTWVSLTGLATAALLLALWFRGRVWNYGLVIGLETFLALTVALAFPIFEFILEAILNEKLRKVGDKVRAHHAALERHYQAKLARHQTQNAAPASTS